jgi:predicted nucleic acid-binding protein
MNEYVVIGIVVAGLSALLSLAVSAKKMFGSVEKREITPQPLEIKRMLEYATRDELGAMEKRVMDDVHVIRADIKELRDSDVRTIEKIDNLTKITYRIAGKMGVVNSE